MRCVCQPVRECQAMQLRATVSDRALLLSSLLLYDCRGHAACLLLSLSPTLLRSLLWAMNDDRSPQPPAAVAGCRRCRAGIGQQRVNFLRGGYHHLDSSSRTLLLAATCQGRGSKRRRAIHQPPPPSSSWMLTQLIDRSRLKMTMMATTHRTPKRPCFPVVVPPACMFGMRPR